MPPPENLDLSRAQPQMAQDFEFIQKERQEYRAMREREIAEEKARLAKK